MRRVRAKKNETSIREKLCFFFLFRFTHGSQNAAEAITIKLYINWRFVTQTIFARIGFFFFVVNMCVKRVFWWWIWGHQLIAWLYYRVCKLIAWTLENIIQTTNRIKLPLKNTFFSLMTISLLCIKLVNIHTYVPCMNTGLSTYCFLRAHPLKNEIALSVQICVELSNLLFTQESNVVIVWVVCEKRKTM